MDTVIRGLHVSEPEPLPFDRSLEIRAFLLQRDQGNLLLYRAGALERDVRAMSWDEFPAEARPHFEALRASGAGETLVLDENFFVETALRATVLDGLSDEDLEAHRQPRPTRRRAR